jgi:hypothetical protein
MIEVLQRPVLNSSTWNAVGNPVVYKFQRKDFTFNQVNDNSGDLQLQFNSVNIASSFTVGDIIYVKSDNNLYDLFAEVKASTFSTNTLVTLETPYVNSAPGGYANNMTKRANYRLEVNLYDLDDVLLTETFVYSPTRKGYLLVNVSGMIRPELLPVIEYTGPSPESDLTIFKAFYISYKEVWTGSSNSATDDDSNPIRAVLASMQIPSATGGNMEDYATWAAGSPDRLQKFLTRFDKLTAWRGWPFFVGFIANEQFSDVGIGAKLINLDGTLHSEPFEPAVIGAVNIFDIFDLFNEDSVLFREILIQLTEDVSSEEKTIELKDACRNPVMLLARNSLGGPLQWLFDSSQEYTHDYGGGRKAKRLVLTAERLTITEWEALEEFIGLGEVYRENIIELTPEVDATSRRIGKQVYVLNPDGSKIGVIAIPTRNTTFTRRVKHRFEIEIEFPEI